MNLKKAKQQYQIRNQEYQKAKDAAIKAESDQHQQLAAADAQQTRQVFDCTYSSLMIYH